MRYLTLALPPIIALAILMILPPHSVRADGKFDVWALIHDGKMAEVRAALADTDLAKQRDAFDAFQTSDPVVGDFSAALLDETPDDPKAMTARGWYLLVTGWTMRGNMMGRDVFPEAAQRMDEMHAEADALAQAALAADPTLVSASDLLMSVSRTTRQTEIVPDEVQRVMALAPNRKSMMIAALALAPQWGGSEDYGIRLCDLFAAKITDVPGYTVEICQIDVVFAARYGWESQQKALEKIGKLDHPVLDGPRLRRATSGRLPPEESIAVLRELSGSDAMTLRDVSYWDRMEGSSDWDGPPGLPGPRTVKALETFLPKMRAATDFDPGDSIALSLYIDALIWKGMADGTPFPTEEIETRFGAMFAVAPYDPESWSRFAYLRGMFLSPSTTEIADVERIRAGFENAAYYSNNSPIHLSGLFGYNQEQWQMLDRRNLDAMDATGEPAFERDAFNAGIVCPTIRSIRVLDAVCEGGLSRPKGCPDYPAMVDSDPRPKLIERAKARKACAAEFAADAEDLFYTAVPMDLPTVAAGAD